MRINPLTAIDFYKADHRRQYPVGTTEVYANYTPRTHRKGGALPGTGGGSEVLFFGLQFFIKDFLLETWNREFFAQDKAKVVAAYKRRMDTSLGDGAVPVEHIAALHDLGYLPIRIKALPEGTLVPFAVPMLTVVNTHPDFFWLTNYLETVLSTYLWKPITSASTAFEYRRLLTHYADKTGIPRDAVLFQAHDFSMRGLSGLPDVASSGAAHLLSFLGTDSVPAIDILEEFYGADADKELVGGSVPATEHSVMCMGMQDGELATFRRLITETYPRGFVSIVSDTWDFWRVLTEYLPTLKPEVMARDGRVVIRPDSGDPIKIIVGDASAPAGSPQHKGAIECLWDVFGGTVTATGHKLLDTHIGLIYGDSITLERAQAILDGLAAKGFASGNVVFGIGSYTYQYVTRDTYGFAMKATSGVVNGERREIYKDPKTDSGTKRSAKGLLRVERVDGKLTLFDRQTTAQEQQGELQTVFENGKLLREETLSGIRARVTANID
ncbi:MAG: nicotinate phosphoribosyltransferase [Alphaproteobacteria bacterium]|nr:nicotinate phosphoribosyltransferase [Alphaproteobacteria bacterium]